MKTLAINGSNSPKRDPLVFTEALASLYFLKNLLTLGPETGCMPLVIFMNIQKILTVIAATTTFFGAATVNAAGVLITYAENPGVQTSTLSNTSFISFDSAANGKTSNLVWAGVGTYDNAQIINADVWGGALGTGKYIVQSTSVGSPNPVPTTTLTLDTPSAYFGLWWSAGDNPNRLAFYSGATLIADFTTETLVKALPDTYRGNPTGTFAGQNTNEKYAFFNVFGQNGVSWDKIVFTNTTSSGFESDNHTTRVTPWGSGPGETGPAPGVVVATVDGTTVTAVPETSTWVMGLLAIGAFFYIVRRNKTRSAAVAS